MIHSKHTKHWLVISPKPFVLHTVPDCTSLHHVESVTAFRGREGKRALDAIERVDYLDFNATGRKALIPGVDELGAITLRLNDIAAVMLGLLYQTLQGEQHPSDLRFERHFEDVPLSEVNRYFIKVIGPMHMGQTPGPADAQVVASKARECPGFREYFRG